MIKKILSLIGFMLFYIKEVVKTNFIVAMEVLTPTHYMKPGIIQINVESLTDRQLLIFCNLLTMTPGSMVVDVDPEKKFILVHILYLESEEAATKEIEESYLRKVQEIF